MQLNSSRALETHTNSVSILILSTEKVKEWLVGSRILLHNSIFLSTHLLRLNILRPIYLNVLWDALGSYGFYSRESCNFCFYNWDFSVAYYIFLAIFILPFTINLCLSKHHKPSTHKIWIWYHYLMNDAPQWFLSSTENCLLLLKV